MQSFTVHKKIAREKIPFILLAFVLSSLTLWAHHQGHMIVSWEQLPLSVRLLNAVIFYAAYLSKMLWPVNLASFYPYEQFFPLWKILGSLLILAAITAVVIYGLRKCPFLFVGWFWYLGALIPVIGLIKSADYGMADRFSYLPSIGIIIMLVWFIPVL